MTTRSRPNCGCALRIGSGARTAGRSSASGADDGATNLGYVRGIAASCVSVVCAWGARGEPAVVAETLRTIRAGRDPELMEPIAVLRINKAGSPAHPLYLPASCRPIPWND